jgi:prolipoprotein diacylglyceryltransferase
LGKPTSLPWGVAVEVQPGLSQLVHPTPLYDAGFNLLWFAALIALRDHPRLQNGNLLKLGLGGYLVFRFAVEFVRNNPVLAWGLTGQQFACLALLAALAVYYGRRWQAARQVAAL